jgi:hypothetical protein
MESLGIGFSPDPNAVEHGLYDGRRLLHRGSEAECLRIKNRSASELGTAAVKLYSVKPLTKKEKSSLRPFKTDE